MCSDDSVTAVVDSFLPEYAEGADAVRCVIARRLATELDGNPPAYVVPRLAGALASILDEIEPRGATGNGKVDLRELLRPLAGS